MDILPQRISWLFKHVAFLRAILQKGVEGKTAHQRARGTAGTMKLVPLMPVTISPRLDPSWSLTGLRLPSELIMNSRWGDEKALGLQMTRRPRSSTGSSD